MLLPQMKTADETALSTTDLQKMCNILLQQIQFTASVEESSLSLHLRLV